MICLQNAELIPKGGNCSTFLIPFLTMIIRAIFQLSQGCFNEGKK